MALIEKPLLTIAIPTYNRSNLLVRNLDSIIASIRGFEKNVEIIISDNNSSDDTELVVIPYLQFEFIKYFKNSENINFNFNYIKIIDKYADGLFCWIIGDDDFLREGSIEFVVELLKNNLKVSFFSLAYDVEWSKESISSCTKYDSSKLSIYDNYGLLLENLSTSGNIFNGFISASIFNTELIKKTNKGFVSKNSFDLPHHNMFPHSCYFALTLNDKNCVIVNEILFYANINDSKGWEGALSQIYLVVFPYIYKYHLDLSYCEKNLAKQKEQIYINGISFLFKNLLSVKHLAFKFHFLKFAIKDCNFFDILLKRLFNYFFK
jgi:glycosyltransferase involved in cell wall biosynthesis